MSSLPKSNRDDTTGRKWDLMRECRRILNRGRLADYMPTSPITCNAEAERRKLLGRARSILWRVGDRPSSFKDKSESIPCATIVDFHTSAGPSAVSG